MHILTGVGVGWVEMKILAAKLVIAYSKIIWIWATFWKFDCIKKREKDR